MVCCSWTKCVDSKETLKKKYGKEALDTFMETMFGGILEMIFAGYRAQMMIRCY